MLTHPLLWHTGPCSGSFPPASAAPQHWWLRSQAEREGGRGAKPQIPATHGVFGSHRAKRMQGPRLCGHSPQAVRSAPVLHRGEAPAAAERRHLPLLAAPSDPPSGPEHGALRPEVPAQAPPAGTAPSIGLGPQGRAGQPPPTPILAPVAAPSVTSAVASSAGVRSCPRDR